MRGDFDQETELWSLRFGIPCYDMITGMVTSVGGQCIRGEDGYT